MSRSGKKLDRTSHGNCSGQTAPRGAVGVEGFDAGLGGKPRARCCECARVVSNEEFDHYAHTLSRTVGRNRREDGHCRRGRGTGASCGHYRCPHGGAFCSGPGVCIFQLKPATHPPTPPHTHANAHAHACALAHTHARDQSPIPRKRQREGTTVPPCKTPPPTLTTLHKPRDEIFNLTPADPRGDPAEA